MKDKIGIIGHGYVGKAVEKLFKDHYELRIYDPAENLNTKEEVNKCDLAIVCVPTAMKEDGSCDTSIVEETVKWLETPLILLKSTVPPGTTDYLKKKYKKNICFSPEFIGEGKYFVPFWKYAHPTEMKYHDFLIIGGETSTASKIADFFQRVKGPSVFYYLITAVEAEIVKYVENSWVAVKVVFCNEYYDICKLFGANYQKVREGFCLDKRVEKMHTVVFPDKRGFRGKCIPKDTNAIVKAAEKKGYKMEVVSAALKANKKWQK